jgi:hypothetical protein
LKAYSGIDAPTKRNKYGCSYKFGQVDVHIVDINVWNFFTAKYAIIRMRRKIPGRIARFLMNMIISFAFMKKGWQVLHKMMPNRLVLIPMRHSAIRGFKISHQ